MDLVDEVFQPLKSFPTSTDVSHRFLAAGRPRTTTPTTFSLYFHASQCQCQAYELHIMDKHIHRRRPTQPKPIPKNYTRRFSLTASPSTAPVSTSSYDSDKEGSNPGAPGDANKHREMPDFNAIRRREGRGASRRSLPLSSALLPLLLLQRRARRAICIAYGPSSAWRCGSRHHPITDMDKEDLETFEVVVQVGQYASIDYVIGPLGLGGVINVPGRSSDTKVSGAGLGAIGATPHRDGLKSTYDDPALQGKLVLVDEKDGGVAGT